MAMRRRSLPLSSLLLSAGRSRLDSAPSSSACSSGLAQRAPLTADDFDSQRQGLLREITDLAEVTAAQTGRQTFAAPDMAALGRVPRHRFDNARRGR